MGQTDDVPIELSAHLTTRRGYCKSILWTQLEMMMQWTQAQHQALTKGPQAMVQAVAIVAIQVSGATYTIETLKTLETTNQAVQKS